MVDYYKVLDISRSATESEVKKAYKKLALKWHPDKNPDNLDEANIRFRKLSEAYEVLSDARRRKIYDARATLRKESSNSNYSKSRGYTSNNGYRYRTRADPNRDYAFNYNDDDYNKIGNRYQSFTFRNLFEVTPFHKLFEKKRRIYDQYGKEGLVGDLGQHRYQRHHHTHDFDEFDIMGGFPFVFRPPEEVFREFFGVNSPFADLFRVDVHGYPQSNRHNNGISSSGRQVAGTKLASPFGAPMLNYSMMDFMMPSNGFTSFSSINAMPSGRGGSGNSAVKRTSTSTTFVNGKKLMTKRVYENGKETVFSYENDVLKSKTVNGVAQKLSSITN
ncbi:dnaJ homolog subfamily B member 6 isoform X1 [Eurosta solidaginis]|uniref:dnaJ homolog subfamily B member 6 isoform X1 n=1 Tax=Eurosta solidaginis TaxID=178769 RepID=UPI003530E410